MAFGWAEILIQIAMMVVSYMLTPKPKQAKPAAAEQADNPVAEAGMPIPKVFGSMRVKSLNTLWFGEKYVHEYEIKV